MRLPKVGQKVNWRRDGDYGYISKVFRAGDSPRFHVVWHNKDGTVSFDTEKRAAYAGYQYPEELSSFLPFEPLGKELKCKKWVMK